MMDVETNGTVCERLRRIAGQVHAVEQMVASDRYCIEVMHELAAVHAALGKATEVLLRSSDPNRLSDAMRRDAQRARAHEVEDLVVLIGRYESVRQQ